MTAARFAKPIGLRQREYSGVGKGGATSACYGVTAVTAVLNGEETLAKTIASISQQDYPELEYVVVDGGSSDATLTVIEAHRAEIDRVVMGPDNGIAEGMNKGLAAATGDLVLFLHADDRFAGPDALSRVMEHVQDLDHIWACDVLFGEGATQRRLRPRPFNAWARLRNPLPHQGVLFPRHLFDRLGVFDTRWRVSMDYELWLRAMGAGVPLGRIPVALSVMGRSGISSCLDWAGLRARFDEERKLQLGCAPNLSWRVLYGAYWPLYLAYRRIAGWLRKRA